MSGTVIGYRGKHQLILSDPVNRKGYILSPNGIRSEVGSVDSFLRFGYWSRTPVEKSMKEGVLRDATDAMRRVKKFREGDQCGAGSPGGAGFEPGNTCARSSSRVDAWAASKFADEKVRDNFLQWFEGSQAIELFNTETGMPVESTRDPSAVRPLTMYHTTSKDFTKFGVAIKSVNSTTFGDVDVSRAAIFVTPSIEDSQAYGKQGGEFVQGASVMPLYISAKNPLDLVDGLSEDDEQKLERSGMTSRYISQRLGKWDMFDDEEGQEVVEIIKKAGYDAVRFNDENPDTGDSFESWAVFSPKQIKSAIANSGEFSSQSADILESDECGAGSPGGAGFEKGNTCAKGDGEESGRVRGWAQKRFRDESKAENFEKWFGDSKAVDGDGNPLTLYHGTDADFDVFQNKSGLPWFYFSDNPNFAEKFAVSAKPVDYSADDAIDRDVPEPEKVVSVPQSDRRKKALKANSWSTGTPGLIVTEIIDSDSKRQRRIFSLTHEASGAALTTGIDYKSAIAFAKSFGKVQGVDWLKSKQELGSLSSEIMGELASIRKKSNKLSTKLLNDELEKEDDTAAMFGYKGKASLGVGSNIKPVHLSMKKPLDLTSLKARAHRSPKALIAELAKSGIDIAPDDLPVTGRDLYQMLNIDAVAAKIKSQAQRSGYDGIVFNDYYDDKTRGTSYIVFEPQQVKSATGNKGTFDPNSPSIAEYARRAIDAVRLLREADTCGAGSPGGAGFEPGNTCAKGSGASAATGKSKPAARWKLKGGNYITWDGSPAVIVNDYVKKYFVQDEVTGQKMYLTLFRDPLRGKTDWALKIPYDKDVNDPLLYMNRGSLVAQGITKKHAIEKAEEDKIAATTRGSEVSLSKEKADQITTRVLEMIDGQANALIRSAHFLINSSLSEAPNYLKGVSTEVDDLGFPEEIAKAVVKETIAVIEEMSEAMANLGPKALANFEKLGHVEIFPSIMQLTAATGNDWKVARINGAFAHGRESGWRKSKLMLTLEQPTDFGFSSAADRRQVINHEIGHVIDGPEYAYSSSKEWKKVWDKEIGDQAKDMAFPVKGEDGQVKFYKAQRADTIVPGDVIHFQGKYQKVSSVDVSTLPASGGEPRKKIVSMEFIDDSGSISGNGKFYAESPKTKLGAEVAPDARLSRYAMTKPSEGFAEFASILLKDKELAKAKFPGAYALWEKWNLLN
ncbi:MAG: hypothetical protein ACK5XN_09485 [Bacteroidota bacterium]